MAYGNPGNPGPMAGEGDAMSGAPDNPPAQPAGEGEKESPGIVHIPSDFFPPGMAKTLKAGEVIEFKILGPPDAEGDVPVEYNTGEKEEKAPAWEDKFREEMSPRKENANPQVPEEGEGGGAGEGY